MTFDDEENDFRGRFYENHENISEIPKKSLFGNAKMRPDFRAAQNGCVHSSENRSQVATFRKNAKIAEFPLF